MGNYTLKKGRASFRDLRGGSALLGLGIGNVYYVIKETAPYAQQFIDDYSVDYSDGTNSICLDKGVTTSSAAVAVLNTGIQDALNKTVANRNDYVIVMPSQADYDIGATLTMSKKCVHLIAPGGLGNQVGATAAARIHPIDDLAAIKISDSSIEVAGFYFKNYSNQTIMQLAQNAYACNIHNNNFIFALSSTTCAPIVTNIVSGNTLNDGGSWGTFESNWFVNSAGGSSTIAVIMQIHGNAKDCRIKYNEFTLSDAITATVGIDNQAVGAAVDFNTFRGDGSTATFTNCVNLIAAGTAIGNRAAVATGQMFSGGTTDANFCDNKDGLDGGALWVEA